MAWTTFILLTATLFMRPAEVVPELEGWRIYELLIIGCLALSWPVVARQISPSALAASPISACVVGLAVAVVLSHLAHSFFWGARVSGQEFGKVVLYYLLLVGLVDCHERLQSLLRWLAAFIAVTAALALLEYHQVVDLPALETQEQWQVDGETGERYTVPRLRATGIFRDPNDLSMVLLAGMVLSAYGVAGGLGILPRPAWLAPLATCAYALALTRSRGGFVALLAGVLVLFASRYGWRRALLGGLVALPLLLALFAGRMTDLATDEGTGQSRIQLWSAGLGLLAQSPLFGTGYATYVIHAGQVAHNSFVHSFAELGMFGGTLFLGAFAIAIYELYRLGSLSPATLDPQLDRLRPYMLTLVTTYAVGMLSLSRAYIVPTYLVLGLAAGYLHLSQPDREPLALRFDSRLLPRLALTSVAFLACTYIFVRVLARWG